MPALDANGQVHSSDRKTLGVTSEDSLYEDSLYEDSLYEDSLKLKQMLNQEE